MNLHHLLDADFRYNKCIHREFSDLVSLEHLSEHLPEQCSFCETGKSMEMTICELSAKFDAKIEKILSGQKQIIVALDNLVNICAVSDIPLLVGELKAWHEEEKHAMKESSGFMVENNESNPFFFK
jgi:hypothetical protein